MHSASPTRGDISHGHFEPSPDLASCYNFLPGCDTGGSINTWALNDSYRSTPESGDSSLPSVQSSPWATGPTPASDANHLHYSENDYLIATEQPSLPALWEMEFNQAISGGCQKEPPHEFNPDSSPGSFPLDDLLEPQSDYLVQGSQYIGGSGF
jgi:hypothetical protein